MRIATVLCAIILFFHVSSSKVDNTHDCNDTASPSTPRNESASQSQEEEIMTPVQMTPTVNESNDCTNSTASSIPTTESTSSTQEEETLISITSTSPSSNSEDCTSTASPSILASEFTPPSTEEHVASTSQPASTTAPPPKGDQKPPMDNYSVSSSDESNTEDCPETTSSSITTSGSTLTSKKEEKTTDTETTSSPQNSSKNGSDTSSLPTLPPEETLTPTKEKESSAHTPTTVTAKPQDCPQGSLMDGYSFFRQNVTITLAKRTFENGKGLEKVRCEKSTLIQDMYYFKRVRRLFSYTNLKGYRSPKPGDPTTGTYDRPSATFIMQYHSETPPDGPYNHMESAKFDGDITYSLPSTTWDHLYTEKECTVVKTYLRKEDTQDTEEISDSSATRGGYHCQLWFVDTTSRDGGDKAKLFSKSEEPPVSECCIKVYQEKCGTLKFDVNDDKCYAVSRDTDSKDGQ